MPQTFYIKRGDTSPAIEATLKDAADAVVDMTGATVRFHLRRPGAKAAKVDAGANLVDPANGKVSFPWQAGHTNEAGEFEAEWEVTFPGGAIETFPNSRDNLLLVRVERDLA